MTVVRLQPDAHRALQELLPWYASGALDEAERDSIEQHLAGCLPCQAELDFERRLLERLPMLSTSQPSDAQAVERGLARWRQRLDEERAASPRAAPPPAPLRWLHWAVAVQFTLIVGLLTLLLAPADRYRGLGDAPAAATGGDAPAQVVVRFRGDAGEREIRAALTASGTRIVNGPTATGAYVLAVPAAHADAAVATLRAQPAVALAESLEAKALR